MDDPAALASRLRSAAEGAGLAGFGVCAADPFDLTRTHLEERAEAGLHAGMRFTYGDPATATDVRRTHPWAERLVVAASAYVPEAGSPGPAAPGAGRIARFAERDHYRPLRAALGTIAAVLEGAGFRAAVLCDDNRLVDRAAAVRAGVGWWGRNTMVLAPGAGPWLLLGSVATDAPLPPDEPMRRDCGTCDACGPACPTGALGDGVLDARRCLAHLLQAPGVIPAEHRAAAGDRVYGCDDCLEACPPGGRALEAAAAAGGRGRVDLLEFLGASDRDLLGRHGHWYVPRRDPRHLRRNALVALGNTGGRDAVGVAAGYLGHRDWLLRAHAAWALGRLGGPLAGAALAAARAGERRAEVRAEIDEALGTLGRCC